MKLYELSAAYQSLLDAIDNEEVTPEAIADTLESITDAIETKAEGYAAVIKTLEAESLALKTEKDRLAKRQSAIDAHAKRLKEHLQAELLKVDIKKVKGSLFTVSIQKNPASLKLDADKLPEKYFVPQPPKPDNAKVKEALKNGEVIEGAELVQTESLRIR